MTNDIDWEAEMEALDASLPERLERAAQMAETQAMVAAALEEAAREIDCGCEHRDAVLAATGADRWKFCGDPCAALDAREVRALIPDAGAALDRALAAAREEGRREEREACYQRAYEYGCVWQELRGLALNSSCPEDATKHLASEQAAFAIAEAIRARAAELKGEKK